MVHSINNIYQFKIEVAGSDPLIWRRVLVESDFTFYELQAVFQIAFDYDDYGYYEFEAVEPCPYDTEGEPVLNNFWTNPTTQVELREILHMGIKKFYYYHEAYTTWKHIVHIENVFTKNKKVFYPVCIGGERKCPPEDLDTIEELNEFVITRKTRIERVKYSVEVDEYDVFWKFNPEEFNIRDVNEELHYINDFLDDDPYK
jgi:hypothetical protein